MDDYIHIFIFSIIFAYILPQENFLPSTKACGPIPYQVLGGVEQGVYMARPWGRGAHCLLPTPGGWRGAHHFHMTLVVELSSSHALDGVGQEPPICSSDPGWEVQRGPFSSFQTLDGVGPGSLIPSLGPVWNGEGRGDGGGHFLVIRWGAWRESYPTKACKNRNQPSPQAPVWAGEWGPTPPQAPCVIGEGPLVSTTPYMVSNPPQSPVV